jgi:hypothetical protein
MRSPEFNQRGFRKRRCRAKRRGRIERCMNWALRGRTRCKFHGGASTGPRTIKGRAASTAARDAGLQRWRERMRAAKTAGEIKKFPCGRKRGARWVTPRMRLKQEVERRRAVQERREAAAAAVPRLPPRRRGRPTDVDRSERLWMQYLPTLSPEEATRRLCFLIEADAFLGNPEGREERTETLIAALDYELRRRQGVATRARLNEEVKAKSAHANTKNFDRHGHSQYEPNQTAPEISAYQRANLPRSSPPTEPDFSLDALVRQDAPEDEAMALAGQLEQEERAREAYDMAQKAKAAGRARGGLFRSGRLAPEWKSKL